jgi:hypothetical protein
MPTHGALKAVRQQEKASKGPEKASMDARMAFLPGEKVSTDVQEASSSV